MGLLKTLLGGNHHGKRGHGYGHGYGHGAPAPCEGKRAAAYGPVDQVAPGLQCASCRTANAPSARFCQSCGTSLLPKACAQCQSTLAASAKFCGQCGAAAS